MRTSCRKMRELALPHTSANWCDVIRLRQIAIGQRLRSSATCFHNSKGTELNRPLSMEGTAAPREAYWLGATKSNLIRSLASRQDGVTQAELRKATGWKLVPMPLIAKRCKMKLCEDAWPSSPSGGIGPHSNGITKREKGNLTRKNGKIASKSGHFATYYMMAHDSTTAVADATTDTVGRKPYPSTQSDAENAS